MTDQPDLRELQRFLAASFRVIREIGHGGMARIYEATRVDSDEPLALKVLRPELVTLVERERFLREIEIVSHLSHPNILPVLASGETPASLYYAMPLLSGGSLRERLERETQLPLGDVLQIVRAIGSALDYAASHHIVHRDVKPGNILFTKDGVPVLADFGIARAIEQAAGDRLTYSQFAIGTPVYMSPEQHAPASRLDSRSDQYSLAVVAYEMLAGMPPFMAATPPAILTRKTLDPMPSLRGIRRELSVDAERALARALAVTPADRHSSASDFANALAVSSPRRRVMTAVAGTVAVAAVGAIIWSQVPKATSLIPPTPRRVAVIPFANVTGDSSLAVVGLMAADWINEGLSRTGVVSVVPTPSVLDARAGVSGRDVGDGALDPEIGRALGATVLVTGRIYLLRDSLRIQTQVMDASQRQMLGTIAPVSIERGDPIRGIEELRTRVMGLLAAEMDPNLRQTAGRSMVPPTFEAYRAFSRGLEEYSRSDFATAARLLTSAFVADSTFAVPLLFASISLSNLGKYAAADSLARRMSALSNSLSPLHRAWLEYRLRLLSGDRAGALQTVRRLAALSPGTKAGYNYAVEAYENGYYEEAIAALRTLDTENGPMRLWAPYWDLLGSSHHLLDNFAAEERDGGDARKRFPGRLFAVLSTVRALAAMGKIDQLQRVLTTSTSLPGDPYGTSVGSLIVEGAREVAAHHGLEAARPYFERARDWYRSEEPANVVMRGYLLYVLGDQQGARRLLEPVATSDSANPYALGVLGAVYAVQGERELATTLALRLAANLRPYQFGEWRIAEARIRGAMGDREATLALLSRALREGIAHDHWMHTMPEFDIVKSDPRFIQMTKARRPE